MVAVNYLLDTHTILWVVRGSDKISTKVKKALNESTADIFISAVSAYEIMYKHYNGKLTGYEDIAENYSSVLAKLGAIELPITMEHAHYAGSVKWDHRDPFDRLLAAQAHINGLVLITDDLNIKALSWVNTLW